MKTMIVSVIAILMLVACGNKNEEKIIDPAQTKVIYPPQKSPYTKKEWRAAFKSSFEEESPKENDDGITEYYGCFKKAENRKCELLVTGERDAFRKIDYFVPFSTSVLRITKAHTYIATYIAIKECENPSIFIEPSIHSKDGWIFMNKVAFMSDGEVVLEHSFEHSQVNLDNNEKWVHETGAFIANKSEQEALIKFSLAKNPIIRITGKKGYLTLPKEKTTAFIDDAKTLLPIFELLEKTLKDGGGLKCDSITD